MYKGYFVTIGKKKPRNWRDAIIRDYEETKILSKHTNKDIKAFIDDDILVIDIDESVEAEKFKKALEYKGVTTQYIKTSKGINFFFKTSKKFKKNIMNTLGLKSVEWLQNSADKQPISVSLKIDGVFREIVNDSIIAELPKWFFQDRGINIDRELKNESLYNLMIPLKKAGVTYDVYLEIAHIVNECVFDTKHDQFTDAVRSDAWEAIKVDNKKVFQQISEEFRNKTTVYLFDDDLYNEYMGSLELTTDLVIRNMVRGYATKDYVEAIREIKSDLIRQRIDPREDPEKVYFKNGTYYRGEFTDDVVFHINQIQMNYCEKPKYESEAIKFIDNLACGDDEVALLLLQMIGYCFMRHQDHMKYFLLVGEGQNGKSVLAKIISGIFNSNFYKNYTSISMKNLSGNFSLHNLKHKLVNFPTENSGQYVDEDVIKTIVSDDLIDADVKNRERTQFVSYATQIFSSNKLASNKDGTLGGTSRMVVIPMNAKFPRSGWRAEDTDIERVYREDKVGFYESFIPIALEAYEDARVNGFAVPKIVAEATEKHIRQSNQVLRWMEENDYNADNLAGVNGATNITFSNTPQEIYEEFRTDMIRSGVKHVYGRGRFYDEIFKHYSLSIKIIRLEGGLYRVFR